MVSELLSLITKNERMSESLVFLSESLIHSFFGQKTSDSLGKQMSEFPAPVDTVHLSNCSYNYNSWILPKKAVTFRDFWDEIRGLVLFPSVCPLLRLPHS